MLTNYTVSFEQLGPGQQNPSKRRLCSSKEETEVAFLATKSFLTSWPPLKREAKLEGGENENGKGSPKSVPIHLDFKILASMKLWQRSFQNACTVIIWSIGTDRSEQTVQTQIRLLLKEQSDQCLLCLLFCLHLLNAILRCKIRLLHL